MKDLEGLGRELDKCERDFAELEKRFFASNRAIAELERENASLRDAARACSICSRKALAQLTDSEQTAEGK